MTYENKQNPEDASLAEKATGMKQRTLLSRSLWWLTLLQVRFRFLIVVLIAAAIVSRWATLQSLWDRWIWNSTSANANSGVSGAHEYFCPMDPGVLSTWPAICPICNMDLVPRRKSDAQMLPEGVVARMQLTPYRIQLGGIRTAAVEAKDLQYRVSFTGTLKTLSPDGSNILIGFDAVPSQSDIAMFRAPRSATVSLRDATGSETAATVQPEITESRADAVPVSVRIVLDDSTALPVGSAVTATILIPAGEVLASDKSLIAESSDSRILCVPESALVDRGDEKLVYVESMPGMFDGIAVRVGRRIGSYYPVLSGLKPGQRVASSGAFLIDAESRLNPSLAAGYFGANQSALTSTSATSPIAPVRTAAKKSEIPELSPEDQKIVDQQKICPVTELSLDSMGGPVPVMIGDRKVFICCAGCEARLRKEPRKYLAKIPKSE